MGKHVFAFYHQNLSEKNLQPGSQFQAKDAVLWNRLTKVVRIKPDEQFILFDEKTNTTIKASKTIVTNQRIVSGLVEAVQPNKPILPVIDFYLPVLKREAFESALYTAAATGIQSIIPVKMAKCHKLKLEEKSLDRLNKIIIAACEQAKNFAVPKLLPPITFEQMISQAKDGIYFDAEGESSSKLATLEQETIPVTVGPEGGFSEQEKESLQQNGFKPYKLTKTILRSREAICIGLGLIRSLTNK